MSLLRSRVQSRWYFHEVQSRYILLINSLYQLYIIDLQKDISVIALNEGVLNYNYNIQREREEKKALILLKL